MQRSIGVVMLALALAMSTTVATAQTIRKATELRKGEGQVYVSIYHVAPGQHRAFLKWMADRDGIDKSVGLPQAQWYVHMEGDSWDYVGIAPVLTDAQQKQEDDAAKAKGMTTGPAASIEFRQFITSHTDTLAAGPMTASEASAELGGQ